MASNAGSSQRSVRGQRANIALTATVAHSAIQGFIHASGVFIGTGPPQPREVFRHPSYEVNLDFRIPLKSKNR
jgi:hypothetical protein